MTFRRLIVDTVRLVQLVVTQARMRRDPHRRAAEIQEWADRADRAEQAERERRVRFGLGG